MKRLDPASRLTKRCDVSHRRDIRVPLLRNATGYGYTTQGLDFESRQGQGF
jgi:hypothetical protein